MSIEANVNFKVEQQQCEGELAESFKDLRKECMDILKSPPGEIVGAAKPGPSDLKANLEGIEAELLEQIKTELKAMDCFCDDFVDKTIVATAGDMMGKVATKSSQDSATTKES